jgi:hypothetical protein
MQATDLTDFLESQDGGALKDKIEALISEVSGAVVDTGKKGKVQLTFELSRIKESAQVNIAATIKMSKPKKRGTTVDDYTVDTPMHVGPGGKVTMFPEHQRDFVNEQK